MALTTKKLGKDYTTVKKVVLTPKREGVQPEYEYSSERIYSYDDYFRDVETTRIYFSPHDWDMQVEMGMSEKFEKVEKILEDRFAGAKAYHGGEVVTEILEALGL